MSNEKKICLKVQVVIIAEEDNQHWLLLLKTNPKRGSFWQNVTGSVENDETFEEAALREAREETNLNLNSLKDFTELNYQIEFEDAKKRKIQEKVFLLLIQDKAQIKIDPHEHQAYQWLNINEVTEDNYEYPSNFQAFLKSKNLLRYQGL